MTQGHGGPPSRRFASADSLYVTAAQAVAEHAAGAIAKRGRFNLALAGGHTPEPLYRRLASPPLREAIDWACVHIWFGDERCVPPDHPRSNYRMARAALLAQVPLPAANVHRMHGEDAPPEAADSYATELAHAFGEGVPRLDLILLGVGEDGHTASLFPGGAALHERRRTVFAEYVEAQGESRLSLTLPVLNAARQVWVFALGQTKADIVAHVFDETLSPAPLPVERISPDPGELTWWLDAAATARLQPQA